jgi:EpsI family protein
MTPAASAPRPAPLASPWSAAAVGAALVASILLVHAEAVRGMLRLWDESPMYSYGYLVPVISAYLAWSRREVLARQELRPSPAVGLGLLGVWALLYAAGHFAAVLLAQQLALVVAIAAATALVWGWPALRTVWAAVAYLLLMVPLWDGFTEPLHGRFQNLSAGIGVRMLDLVGIPAYREGTFIALPTLTLEVARACSGVNYLVAVLALGLPLGYLYLRSPWRRVALLVSAMLIAALSNSLRVALIGVLVHLDIGAALHGPGHTLHGLFVSGIGHVVLFVGLAILRRGERADDPPAATTASPGPAGQPVTVRSLAPAFVCAAVFAAVAGLTAWREPMPIALVAALDRLPARLGEWTADPYATPAPLPWWHGADADLRRTYHRGGRAVDVHVVYFPTQRQSQEVVTYRASELHRDARPLDVRLDAAPARVNLATDRADGEARLSLFWYELDGVVEAEPSSVKLRTLWHALGRGRTNGAVVCLRTADPGPEAREAVVQSLTALAAEVHAGLAASLPRRTALAAAAVAPASAAAPSGEAR